MIQIFNHSHSLMHMNSSLLFSRLSGVTLAVLALMAASAQAQQAQRAEPAGKARAAAQAAFTENEPAEDEYEATMPKKKAFPPKNHSGSCNKYNSSRNYYSF